MFFFFNEHKHDIVVPLIPLFPFKVRIGFEFGYVDWRP